MYWYFSMTLALEEDKMKMIRKSKLGFTLIEMVLVLTIIFILASVLFIGVAQYLKQADDVKKMASEKNSTFVSKQSDINNDFIDLGY
jgi:prepilin-type N-terminal cleavage/methylation domain-containing protein